MSESLFKVGAKGALHERAWWGALRALREWDVGMGMGSGCGRMSMWRRREAHNEGTN
jgi:hypothetical protein